MDIVNDSIKNHGEVAEDVTENTAEETPENTVEDAAEETPEDTVEEVTEETPEDKIIKWKEAYPNGVFMSVYEEDDFVWHKIGRKDYTAIMESFKDNPEMSEEDAIINRQKALIASCLLYPEEPDFDELFERLPGIIVSLSTEILSRSGFTKPLTVKL